MYPGDTQNLLCLLTITLEIVLFSFQIIFLLHRPDDKKGVRYLFLLIFLLAYNTCNFVLPNPDMPMSEMIQIVIDYAIVFFALMYFIYYFYKAYNLSHLRFFATYGLLIFIFAPYVFLFVIPYYITNDVVMSRQLTVIIPATYGAIFMFYAIRSFIRQYKKGKIYRSAEEQDKLTSIIPASAALTCWAALPVIIFFHSPGIEQIVVNTGFLLITANYLRFSIIKSKKEQSILRQQTSTMTSLAYETKTPLMLINNYFHDFKARYNLTEGAEELDIIQENLRRLTSGIQNFNLDHKNSDQLNVINNISLMVKTKVILFESLAQKKDVVIIDDIEPDIFLREHPEGVDRILNTLIENAITHSPGKGKVEISLRVKGAKPLLSVIDNGIKISLDLPDVISIRSKTKVREVQNNLSGTYRPHIMLIENQTSGRDSLSMLLQDRFNVYIAVSRAEALQKIKSIPRLDLIIADILEDTVDDLEFRKKVIANDKFGNTPFIFLTDQKSHTDKRKEPTLESAVDYIEKPVVMTDLMEKIDAYIDKINSEKETIREAFGSLRKTYPASLSPDSTPQPFRNAFEYKCWRCNLTPREIEIIHRLNLGRSHKYIGDELHISKKTVDTHVNNIFNKVRETFGTHTAGNVVELLNMLEIRSHPGADKPSG